MICPCCGNTRSIDTRICAHCQAQFVDEPMIQPENKLPSMGPALLAFGLTFLVLLAFLIVWVFSNDMKVIRVLLVSLLNDSTAFSKSLLQGDPDLLRYRIFTFDAYRLACVLSIILAPISIVGIWLSQRARKLSKIDPFRFGGLGISTTSLILAIILFLGFSTAGISSIPRAIQNGRLKHIAETRARFYHLHVEALTRYYAENGTYPQELSDLNGYVPTSIPQSDYWGNSINYTPTGVIASKKSAPLFSNYQLVSAGPDGIMDTADDIRMIDGVIISASDETDPISGFFSSGK